MRSFISSLFTFILLTSSASLYSQNRDTVRLMAYNLLNYDNNSIGGCTSTNNNSNVKESNLKAVIDYSLPDILVCNEIGTGNPLLSSFRIAQDALNQNGRTYYSFTTMQTGNRQNINSSATGNMIYWDNRKFGLYDSTYIEFDPFNRALVRVIDLYTLYYKDPNLAVHGDTLFLNIFIAHLKAGNSVSDRNERDWATDAVMAYLDSNNLQGNYVIAGDLNLYTASETAYQNLINYPVQNLRFSDPINVAGNWSNNTPFAIVHTQSTRTASGCGAGGGMDDRFDFILASDEILNGTDSIEYISGTYKALGQDGARFNGTLTGPPANTSGVPTTVLQAMENLSDHLPVQMDLLLNLPATTSIDERISSTRMVYNNPVDDLLKIRFDEVSQVERIQLMNMAGKIVKDIRPNQKEIEIDCSVLNQGIYLIRVLEKKGGITTQKLIKI